MGKAFSDYLVKKGLLRRDQLINSKLKDGSFIFFRARDDKGRMAILRLTGKNLKVDATPREKEEILKQRKLVLSYRDSTVLSNLMQQRKKKFSRSRR